MEKKQFRTIFTYDQKKARNCESGSFTEMRHRANMKSNGERELIKDKEIAIYDLIQASREECEIENIIRRCTEGDYNALNQGQGVYTDITGAPKSIAEAQQWIIQIKEKFDELPAEIKAKFDNNVEIYCAQFGSEEWADKVGYTEALRLEEEQRQMNIKYDETTRKAMENLATGNVVVQTGGEANGK